MSDHRVPVVPTSEPVCGFGPPEPVAPVPLTPAALRTVAQLSTRRTTLLDAGAKRSPAQLASPARQPSTPTQLATTKLGVISAIFDRRTFAAAGALQLAAF